MLSLLLPVSEEELEAIDGLVTVQKHRWERNMEKGMPDKVKRPVIDEVRRDSALAALWGMKQGDREYLEVFRYNLSNMIQEYKEYTTYKNCTARYTEEERLAVKYEGALRRIVKTVNSLGYQRLAVKAREGDSAALQRLSEMTGYNMSLIEKIISFVHVNSRGRLCYCLPRKRDRILPLDRVQLPYDAVEWWQEFRRALAKEDRVPDPFLSDILWTVKIAEESGRLVVENLGVSKLKRVEILGVDETGMLAVYDKDACDVEYLYIPAPQYVDGAAVYSDPSLLLQWDAVHRIGKCSESGPECLSVTGIYWIPGGEELDEECCEA